MSTSTSVHLTGFINPKVAIEFNDYLDCATPFRTLKLCAGEHEVNVFFMEHGGPNLVDVLKQIIEAATTKLDELSASAWVNAVSELGVKS
jgi:hypothetical protein